MAKGYTHKSRRKTPWDGKEQKTPMQEFICQQYETQYDERHRPLYETGKTELINSYVPDECPNCTHDCFKLNGRTRNGVQRYLCFGCNQTFTPVTRTIFEGHKVSLSEWIEYVLNIFRYVSINADSWNNRNAFTTSRYWLEKLFFVLDTYQQGLILSGKVWFDETYYSVRSRDITRTEDGKKLRGLSSNQMRIGVACDKNNSICIFEGFGKPSQKSTYESFKNHIEQGSTLIHDKEKAHKNWSTNCV